jgi:membrane-bound lytic murein transglycosylase F
MGYQLDLLRLFAKDLGVSLKIIASNDISELYYFLDLHIGDIIALNIPVTKEGKMLLNYSADLGETQMVLIQRKPVTGDHSKPLRLVTSYTDFTDDTIYFRSNAFFLPLIRKFIDVADHVNLLENRKNNPEELVRMVSEGKIDYAICPENLARVLAKHYTNIDAGLTLSGTYKFAWGAGHYSDSLLARLNAWMEGMNRKNEMQNIYLSYFDNPRIQNYFQNDYCSLKSGKISPFDAEIRKESKLLHWDWRLLASLIYEESNFRTGQVSGRNATGLMQLTPEIAGKFGMDSTSSVAKQIDAGVKYLKWLDKHLPDEITDPRERIQFILAAYNVGLGRILLAREKAVRYGRDPNKWSHSVDYYLTHKSKREPVQKTPERQFAMSYPEPGGYVNDILDRYNHYRNIIPR